MAYKLKLPSTSAIHPVFHVLQLKPSVHHKDHLITDLPIFPSNLLVPSQILNRRLSNRGEHAVAQVLIRRSGQSLELVTWEDEEALRAKFPEAPAWGQACSQEGGNVSATTPPAQEGGNP